MLTPSTLRSHLRLPLICSPLFTISNPALVIAQCQAGVIGSFPALNARPISQLDEWLAQITETLGKWDAAHPEEPAAPFAVNQIVHRSNGRLEQDLDLCVKWKVPIIITSLGAREDVNAAVHSYGGITLHDVTTNRYARKAVEKGADGLILVAAGAGGHCGAQSPFALVQEVRAWFDGPIVLSGAIASGDAIFAAQAMGADLAYAGSAFIATTEASADAAYKAMVVKAGAEDIVTSSLFTGVSGNYLKPSIARAGLDPDHLPGGDPAAMNFSPEARDRAKPWRDIWGCGQGIGAISGTTSAAELIARFEREYRAAAMRMAPVIENTINGGESYECRGI